MNKLSHLGWRWAENSVRGVDGVLLMCALRCDLPKTLILIIPFALRVGMSASELLLMLIE